MNTIQNTKQYTKQYVLIYLRYQMYLLAFILLPASVFAAETKIEEKNLIMSFETGLGYDDNIYRAPDSPYIDYGKNTPVAITPVIYSSPFIPLRFLADYASKQDATNTIVSSYKFKGTFYTNRDYSNADQQLHKINFGNVKNYSTNKKQDNELYTGIFLGYRKRLYVDRDTGDNQQSGPDDISDRYTYNFFGGKVNYKKEVDNIKYQLYADFESRNYVKVGTVSEYDNTQLGIAGDIGWRVARTTKLYAGLELYKIDYATRPSRDVNGNLFKSNPVRKYTYNIISVGMRHRFNRAWLIYLDFINKQRTDQSVGYDNYTKMLYKARIHYRANKELRFKLSLSSWDRDYDNAFAFDDVNQVKKTYSGTIVKVAGNYKFSDTMAMNLSYLVKNQDSTDLRYAYDRSIVMANMEWLF